MKLLTRILFLGFFLSAFVFAQAGINPPDNFPTPPSPSITPSGTINKCVGEQVVLTVQDTVAGSTFQWIKDDIDITAATSAIYTVTTAGEYKLRVTSSGSPSTTGKVTVIFFPVPVANFTFSPGSGCGKTKVSFTNLSHNGTVGQTSDLTYLWDFGNGETSTKKNPDDVTYMPNPKTGLNNYPIKLIVTDSVTNCKDTIIDTVRITSSVDATLGIGATLSAFNEADYYSVCVNTGITETLLSFSNLSATKGVGSNTGYEINWGDGQDTTYMPTFATIIKHKYQLGTYVLRFIVKGSPCNDTSYYNIFIGSNPAIGLSIRGNSSVCTGDSLVFDFDDVIASQNPNLTIYKFWINDGSDTITYSHPLPDTVLVKFNQTSCGFSGNELKAYIRAISPCGYSDVVAGPIYVNQTPEANFSKSKDTVCVNTSIDFSNTGKIGTAVVGGNCQNGNFVWQVEPALGFEVVSGALGDDFLDPTESLWDPGTKDVSLLFTEPGKYIIKLKQGSYSCGISEYTDSIFVNPFPLFDISIDDPTICAGETVTATTVKSNSPAAGEIIYSWSVTKSSVTGCAPSSDPTIFNPNQQTTSINFPSPGLYTLSVLAVSPGGCSTIVNKQYAVKDKPSVSLSGVSSVCQNIPYQPTATLSCFESDPTTYLWSFSNGSPSPSTTLVPDPVYFSTIGDQTVEFSATNACGTTTSTLQVYVKELPPVGPVVGVDEICQLSTTTFTNSISGGTWFSSNTSVATVNPTSGLITGITGGTSIITYTTATALNGCYNTATKQITVITNPTTGPISDQLLCDKAFTSDVVFTSTVTGTQFSWVNDNPSIGLASSGTGNISSFQVSNNTSSAIVATITVTPSNAGSSITCAIAPSEFTITVNPKPSIQDTSIQTCSDATLNFSPVNNSSNIVPSGTMYTWTVTDNLNVAGEKNVSDPLSNISQTLINLTNVSQQVVYIVTPIGGSSVDLCTGQNFTLTVTVDPTPVVPAQRDTICSGGSFTLTLINDAPTTIIPDGTTYSWSSPTVTGGIIGGAGGTLQSIITGTLTNPTNTVQTATYVITPVSPTGCVGEVFTLTVTVNPIPVIPAQRDAVCSGTTFIHTIVNDAPTTIVPDGTTYSWSSPTVTSGVTGGSSASGVSIITGTLTNPTNTVQTATYVITPLSPTGCAGEVFTLTVTVSPIAHISDTATIICGGDIFSIQPTNGNGNIVPDGTKYIWTVDPNPNVSGASSISIPQSSISQILSNLTTDIQTVRYNVTPISFDAVTCSGPSFTITVTLKQTPVIPSQDISICSGGTFTLTLMNSPPTTIIPDGTTYSWSVPVVTGGVTGGASASGVSIITGTLTNPTNTVQTATYEITPVSPTGCVGEVFTLTVTINPIPVIPAQTKVVCSNETFTHPIVNSGLTTIVPDGTTYSWSVPVVTGGVTGGASASGVSIITGTLTNPTTTVQTATYVITPVSPTGCPGEVFTLTVTVNPKPFINNTSTEICSEDGFSISPTNGSGNIVPDGTTYTWVVSANSNVTGQSAVNIGQPVIGQTLRNLTNIPQQLIYSVTPASLTIGNCPGDAFTITVTVDPRPAIFSDTKDICSGDAFNIAPVNGSPNSSTIVPANTKYTWVVSSNANVTGQSSVAIPQTSIGQTLVNLTNVVQTLKYTVTPISGDAGSCVGSVFTSTVNVNPKPNISDTSAIICSEETFSITPQDGNPNASIIVPANTTYTWTVTDNINVTGDLNESTPKTSISHKLTNLTNIVQVVNYVVTPMSEITGTCIGASFNLAVTVNPKPSIPDTSLKICSDETFSLQPQNGSPTSSTIVPANTTYTWTVTDNPNVTGDQNESTSKLLISQSLTNLTNVPQLVEYIVTPISGDAGNCLGASFKVSVTVNPKSSIPDSNAVICSDGSFSITPQDGYPTAATIVPAGTRYTWTVIDNVNVTGDLNESDLQTSIGQTLRNLTNIAQTVYYLVTPVSGAAGNCSSGTFTITVTVNPKPYIPVLSDTICNGLSFNVLPINGENGAIVPDLTSYSWTIPASEPTGAVTGGTAETVPQLSISQTLANITDAPATLQYVVTPASGSYGNCVGSPFEIIIKVDPDTKADFNPPKIIDCHPYVINNAEINLTTYPFRNDLYKWYINDVLYSTGTNFPNYTIVNQHDSITLKLVTTSLYGCKSDSVSTKFYTYRLAYPKFVVDQNEGCGPLTVNFFNTTPEIDYFAYEWDFGNGIKSNKKRPDAVIFNPNPTYEDTTYIVILTATSDCNSAVYTQTILVKSKPKSLFTPSNTVGCSPLKIKFNNTSKGVGNTYVWDFGDGTITPAATRDTIWHTYYTLVKDTFIAKLYAYNDCGVDSSEYNIIVSPNTLKLDFAVNGTDKEGCTPHNVRFINNTSGATSFFWNFGDGNTLSSTKNVDTVIHTYLNSGKYEVTLYATNGCSDSTTTEEITVYGLPVPEFNASKTTFCIGDSVYFNNTSTDADSYKWDYGDGVTSNFVNPGHKYSSSGQYTVKLIAYKTNIPGIVCTDTIVKFVTVVDTLAIKFDPADTTGYCSPFTVTFKNEYTNNIYAEWDFGDITTARGNSVEHTYTIPGTYQVKLSVKGSGGCNYIGSSTVQLFSPTGTVDFKTGFSCIGESIKFEATPSSTDSIEWHFGDGDRIITKSTVVTHAYSKPGIYIPKVKFLNADGCAYDVVIKDTIKIDQVISGFTVSQEEFCGYTKVLFKDTSFTFFGKDSIQWTFGDESTGNLFEESHIYTSSNTYLVQSIVTGISGCKDTTVVSVPVFVRSLPFVQVKGDSVICTGEEVRLEAVIKSEDPILLEKWIGPNGSVIYGTVYENTFVTSGYYRFAFILGTIYGCYDTTYYNVLVNPTPAVKTLQDFTLCYGNSATLTATGADSIYNWFPTEGLSCSNCRTPVAKPDNSISYVVRGTTKKECYAFDTVNITVVPPIDVTVSKDDSICIGESVQLLARGAKYYRWFPAEGLSSDTIQNPIATPTRTTRYRVIGYDEYGCFRDTAYVLVGVGDYPKVNLGPDRVLSTGTLLKLEPTFTEGPIETWLWKPDKELSCSNCPSAIVQVKTDITYVVKATNYFGCSGTDSINIKVFCTDAQVYIPNAFTPDNDGYNDIFMIRATGIQQIKSFRIFNRWGALIFEKINFKPNDPNFAWDGTIRGRTSAQEVFVYTVEVLCDDGTPYFYKGNVSLLK